ncbi:MAG: hypothetical protein WBQ72_05605 [Terriglobales bacterium]
MKSLKAKLALLLLVLATVSAIPVQLMADGNPIPVCGDKYCPPPPAQ